MQRIKIYLVHPQSCPANCQFNLAEIANFRIKAPDETTALRMFYEKYLQFNGIPCRIKIKPDWQK